MDERLMWSPTLDDDALNRSYRNGLSTTLLNPPHRDGSRECQPVPEEPRANQVGGDHYTKMPIQVFDFTMANKMDPMQHTIIKYVARFRDKGGIEDLKKAKHTIDLLIAHEYAAKD
jgi:hypothetical protein